MDVPNVICTIREGGVEYTLHAHSATMLISLLETFVASKDKKFAREALCTQLKVYIKDRYGATVPIPLSQVIYENALGKNPIDNHTQNVHEHLDSKEVK
jgi:hypothetical protein